MDMTATLNELVCCRNGQLDRILVNGLLGWRRKALAEAGAANKFILTERTAVRISGPLFFLIPTRINC
jgi:hypothetical protein